MRLGYVLLLLVALLPRLLDLGSFVTDDEANFWLHRSERFLDALRNGDAAATAIAVHPGVTTMWLGSAGILLRRALRAWQVVPEIGFPLLLALMRLPVVLVHVAGILVGAWLLRRLLPAGVALLAALLWAADPFIIGYSRLLHVDALAATFATLSLLAACDYWYHTRQRGVLLLSAACAALAVLSKSPALVLLPLVAGVALTTPTAEERPLTLCALRSALLPLLLWGGMFALTIVLVWPAVWAEPQAVYELLRFGVANEGAEPHMTGNFFLGREDPEPGVRFYPVALVLRLTPLTLAGVLLLLVKGESVEHRGRTIAVLLAFVLLFTLAMSFFPKKFNRYLVPIFPALDMLAAVGLARGIAWASSIGGRVWGGGARRSVLGARRSAGVLVLAVVGNVAWWHPYHIAAFNQVLGGAAVGSRTFSVGWGEGLEQVAAWLNQQPDITGVVTVADKTLLLNPYLKHGAQATTPDDGTLPEQAGYVVVYIYQVQGTLFPPFDQFYPHATPLHTVRLHGVEYAWVYQVPPPVAHPLPADFGTALHLRGFAVAGAEEHPAASGTLQPGGTTTFTLFWQTTQPPPADYWLFAHLLDADGQRYAHADIPYPTSTWGARRFITTEVPLTIAPDTPPGEYTLFIGLYDVASGERLPLTTAAPPDPAGGADALRLTTLRIGAETP